MSELAVLTNISRLTVALSVDRTKGKLRALAAIIDISDWLELD